RVAATRLRSDKPASPADSPRLAELEAELRDARATHETARAESKERDETLAQRTAALAELDGEAERLRIELSRVKEESETRVVALRTVREELEQLRAAPPAPQEDFASLETSLAERARRVLELE